MPCKEVSLPLSEGIPCRLFGGGHDAGILNPCVNWMRECTHVNIDTVYLNILLCKLSGDASITRVFVFNVVSPLLAPLCEPVVM